MYFQLLHGVHVKGGKTYAVTFDRNKETGEIIVLHQPIIESDKDLVVAYGSNKFRRVHQQEAKALLAVNNNVKEEQDIEQTAPPLTAESDVSKAVKDGAKEIAEPPGIDVTDKFPELDEIDPKGSVRIYFKRPKGYFVTHNDEVITTEPLKKSELLNWVKVYMGD